MHKIEFLKRRVYIDGVRPQTEDGPMYLTNVSSPAARIAQSHSRVAVLIVIRVQILILRSVVCPEI
jgi:hypothetical protein